MIRQAESEQVAVIHYTFIMSVQLQATFCFYSSQMSSSHLILLTDLAL